MSLSLPVAVVGAGPVGLAAAAHLLNRGIEPLVLEAGAEPASNLRQWGHVRLFSPWRYDIDAVAASLLRTAGWEAPPDDALPTGAELVARYLAPLAALPALTSRIRLRHRVQAITRLGFDKVLTAGREAAPFVLRVGTPGGDTEILARAVIDASGTWGQPNPIGAGGIPALGEAALAGTAAAAASGERGGPIAYGIPDVLGAERETYAGRATLVVGAGHSAANVLLDLAALARQAPGTRLLWAVRGKDLSRVIGGGAADGLPARAALGASLGALRDSGTLELATEFRIETVSTDAAGRMKVRAADGRVLEGIERIVGATGQRPDLAITRELRLRLDPWLECAEALGPLIDPNLHSCGTVRPHGARELSHPEAGFFTAGVKSYGRAPTFLLATGYEQVRSIAALLAGDVAAAREVRLELPETGVCSTDRASPAAAPKAGGCCPPRPESGGCCG
ncbi:NAD(P)-binding protein [Arenibaculum pallidiluteum]|uniref:NAD(P)-binding protein n=1 Tax=Arenibaculum pallidiluteum TaxID=2812559 RepID=UPI001A9747B1|nr:NAD(P)-binding protein [Arenibaculum pallidiluteum]